MEGASSLEVRHRDRKPKNRHLHRRFQCGLGCMLLHVNCKPRSQGYQTILMLAMSKPLHTVQRLRRLPHVLLAKVSIHRKDTVRCKWLIYCIELADYSPWSRSGDHPEDRLTEFAVKQGYYDKAQGPGNSDVQSQTSKLASQLKNRSGLQLLSSVFAAALEKRQVHDKISSTSTFKPPPRVTLTDNKREAWLRDLANASVPLRRLSRTIPHGIRGKLLLDQCLGKGVPIGRAVWLAKCVGANEIRAFKRKGTSGSLSQGLETKWVREWTVSVQQFIEGVIAACGKVDWRNKMTYA